MTMSARQLLDRAMTEAQFQDSVIALAKLRGWKVAHFRTVRIQRADGSVYYATPVEEDGEGWPDWIMVRGKRMIAAELKSERGRASAEQLSWLAALGAVEGVDSFLWRPSSWDQIEEALK